MAKTLTDAIKVIQTHAVSLAGVMNAPENPLPEMQLPFAVTYPARGTLNSETANADRDIHRIFSEIHLAPNLAEAVKASKTILESYGELLKNDPQLSDTDSNPTVDTIVFPIEYSFGRLEWAGDDHVGFRFEINVKQRNAI